MEIFTRKFSEISGGRFDAEFYAGQTIQIATYPLKNFVKIKSGKRIPKEKSYANATTRYKYLRVDDLDSEVLEIDIDKLKSIDEDIFTLLQRYEIHNNEIALSIAGTIGKIFVFHNETSNRVILTENCVRLQAQDKLLPKFLSLVLKTDFLQNQMKRQYIQTTIPKLAIERIKELQIPPLPPIPTQRHIIDIMDKAYKAKKEKENKAKELLDSIDSYLLNALGIILPEKEENNLQNRIFTQKFSALSGSRFDCNYHQSYYQKLESALTSCPYPLTNLASLIESFAKGIEVGSSAYQKQGVPFVRVSDISNRGIDFDNVQKFISASLFENLKAYKPKENELLYSKDGSIGLCLKADTTRDYVISGGIVRLKVKNAVDSDFLCFLLGSMLMNIFANRSSIGAVIRHLNIGELLNLKIPLPLLSVQRQIAQRLKDARFQALELEKEAKKILKMAKIDIETLLLASGGGAITLEFSFEAFLDSIKESCHSKTDCHTERGEVSKNYINYFEKVAKVWNEREYSVVTLRAIVKNMRTGTTPHKNLNPYLQNTNIKFVRNSDIQNGELVLNDVKTIDENLKNILTYSYKNEVLVCIAGTIGISALNDIGVIAINQNISSLKFYDEVSPSFVSCWLNSKIALDFFHRNATIATILYINNQALLNLKIPLPSLPEQKQIAKEIEQRKAKAKALQNEAKEILDSAKKKIESIILGG